MKNFILDVDGVMTTGHFVYGEEGKMFKIFGPDDSDGLAILKKYIQIEFVSADKRGFKITEKRIKHDMGFEVTNISSHKRLKWMGEKYELDKIIYMGDGFFDANIMHRVGYSIAPQNADVNASRAADFVTSRAGGDRAVAEACVHILAKFFNVVELK